MPAGGREYLELMNDQARRAADFDRRIRWSRLRKELRVADPVDQPDQPDQCRIEALVDVTPIAEPAEPARGA